MSKQILDSMIMDKIAEQIQAVHKVYATRVRMADTVTRWISGDAVVRCHSDPDGFTVRPMDCFTLMDPVNWYLMGIPVRASYPGEVLMIWRCFEIEDPSLGTFLDYSYCVLFDMFEFLEGERLRVHIKSCFPVDMGTQWEALKVHMECMGPLEDTNGGEL